ncbi:hypothetical protein GJAV_G00143620 [Gymnothorax javanicus]|nr:hypothetical protein GJAV_G00143620 [Gymnothorax javanicus]
MDYSITEPVSMETTPIPPPSRSRRDVTGSEANLTSVDGSLQQTSLSGLENYLKQSSSSFSNTTAEACLGCFWTGLFQYTC